MADKNKEQEQPQQGVTLTLTPEALQQMVESQHKNRKAVKLHDGDSIGIPTQPIIGTGEGLKEWVHCRIEIGMGTRVTTKPGGKGDEGYPTFVKVMNVLKKIKAKEESIAMQNKHIGGCILSSPGTPNQTTWYFEMGTVNENETLKCDAIWEPQYYNGRVINYNYELQIQPSTAKA